MTNDNPPTSPLRGREREVLQRLYNEVAGVWSAFEHELRNGFGHTNYACVQLRIDEAKAVLAQPASPLRQDWSCVADFLDDIEVDAAGMCRWSDVANAQTLIRQSMPAAPPASPLRGRDARLQLALIGVLDYERESAKLRGFSDCTCMGHSMEAENAYEMGECPHQKAHAALTAPPEQPSADRDESTAFRKTFEKGHSDDM